MRERKAAEKEFSPVIEESDPKGLKEEMIPHSEEDDNVKSNDSSDDPDAQNTENEQDDWLHEERQQTKA